MLVDVSCFCDGDLCWVKRVGEGRWGVDTGLVCTTSLRVRFIHVSQVTRWPLRVSPFLSSTSIGWPWAAFRRPRGSCGAGQLIVRIGG